MMSLQIDHEPEEKLIYEQESHAIRGAIFDVYREMGCGFLEAVYQECLQREFALRKVPFVAQTELPLKYKGALLTQKYRADFICYDKIIIEIKAISAITNEHRAQVFNYLKASGFRLGILVNFGNLPKATIIRIVI